MNVKHYLKYSFNFLQFLYIRQNFVEIHELPPALTGGNS